MLFSLEGTVQRTLARGTFTAGMVLALVVVSTCFRPAVAQNNWLGTTSSDYFTDSNWSTGSVPITNQAVRIGANQYVNAPVYNGDNSATPTNDLEIYGNDNGTFTMEGGTLVVGDNFRVGHAASSGMATFTMNGGFVKVRLLQFLTHWKLPVA